MVIDMWEDNAGGLYIVDRDSTRGWCGMEQGQNDPRNRVAGRTSMTLASDCAAFDDITEAGAYQPICVDEQLELYEREGRHNMAVRVATWADGKIEIHAAPGRAARWYLDQAEDM